MYIFGNGIKEGAYINCEGRNNGCVRAFEKDNSNVKFKEKPSLPCKIM